jgi:hypothetical protein
MKEKVYLTTEAIDKCVTKERNMKLGLLANIHDTVRKLQGSFYNEVLRVRGSEFNGASKSELGKESIIAKIQG